MEDFVDKLISGGISLILWIVYVDRLFYYFFGIENVSMDKCKYCLWEEMEIFNIFFYLKILYGILFINCLVILVMVMFWYISYVKG